MPFALASDHALIALKPSCTERGRWARGRLGSQLRLDRAYEHLLVDWISGLSDASDSKDLLERTEEIKAQWQINRLGAAFILGVERLGIQVEALARIYVAPDSAVITVMYPDLVGRTDRLATLIRTNNSGTFAVFSALGAESSSRLSVMADLTDAKTHFRAAVARGLPPDSTEAPDRLVHCPSTVPELTAHLAAFADCEKSGDIHSGAV